MNEELILGSYQGQEIFHYYSASRPNVWPIQPPVHLVLMALPTRVKEMECQASSSSLVVVVV